MPNRDAAISQALAYYDDGGMPTFRLLERRNISCCDNAGQSRPGPINSKLPVLSMWPCETFMFDGPA